MRYLFGDHVLDTQRAELHRAGVPIRLRRQAFQVLVYLLAHRDRVVPKQEILEHLWPDQFVGDEVLKACIKAVRQALGEQGRTPRCLRTLHGQGYRFVAPVEVQEPLPVDAVPPALTPTGEREGVSGASAEVVTLSTGPVPLPPASLPPLQRLTGERLPITVLCGTLADATALADRLGFEALQ